MAGFGRDLREHWALDPEIVYLNHGTVGAPPRRVLAAQQAIRDAIERQPSRYLLRELAEIRVGGPRAEKPRLRAAAEAVGEFLGARGDDLVFVDNATAGVNAVLRSLDLRPGDELVVTDHGYGAVNNVAAFVARGAGAAVRTVALPYRLRATREAVDAYAAVLTPRTRVVIVDHVTSETALVMPVAELIALGRAHGAAVLVDGAHAPGALDLDIAALGADWYVGNLHKWAYSPRSCGILWAPPARQAGLHPPVVSWGLDQGFTTEFDWVGTRDPSPYLAAPAGIAFLRELGAAEVRAYNHSLAWRGAGLLTRRWETDLEVDEATVGTMATVPLPARAGSDAEAAARLRDALLFEDCIEVQMHAAHGRLWARISAQVYNDLSDVERLAEAVLARV